jgi:hypothetical protein
MCSSLNEKFFGEAKTKLSSRTSDVSESRLLPYFSHYIISPGHCDQARKEIDTFGRGFKLP